MFYCQFDGHQRNQIIGVCLSKNCETSPFFCPQCLIHNLHQSHSKFDCFQFDQIKTLLIDRKKTIQKFTEVTETPIIQFSIDLKKIEKYNFNDQMFQTILQKLIKIYQKFKELFNISKKVFEIRNTISKDLEQNNYYQVYKKQVQYLKYIHFQSQNQIIRYNDQVNFLMELYKKKIQNLIDKFLQKEKILFTRSSYLLESKQFEQAINTSSKLLELRPLEAKNLVQKGNILFHMESYEEAIKYFDQAIDVDKFYLGVYYLKGKFKYFQFRKRIKKDLICFVLLKLEDFDYAIFNFSIELDQNPYFDGIIDLLMKKGTALSKMKLYEDAVQCYDKIIQKDNNYVEAYFAKAVALQNQGEYYLATCLYDIVLEHLPKDSEAKYNKGCALSQLERFEEAVQYFQDIQISDPNFKKIDEVIFNLGIALCRLNQIQDAIVAFQIAEDSDPDNLDILFKSGQTLLLMNEFKEARKYFQKFLQLSKDHQEGNLNMGIILYNLKQYEGAATHLRKVLLKDNFNYEALKYHGLCLLKQNQYDKSILSFDQMLKINQNNIEAKFYKGNQLGKILYKMKNYDQAMELFDNIISSNPNNENSIYFKGKSLHKIEKYSDAIQWFYKVLSLNPNHLKAKKQLNQTLEDQGIVALD